MNGWSEQSCLAALEDCAEDLGESPTLTQYREWRDETAPSKNAITRKFGSWNEAKEAADLETYAPGNYPNYRLADGEGSES